MNKIVFSDQTEIEISDVTQANDELSITINTSDVNSVIEKFQDKTATKIMRYYSGIDLIRGYSGFTQFDNVTFTPNVVIDIDYSVEDSTTQSGFLEITTDRCVITMHKASIISFVAGQVEQNTANIDYVAMETGIEL